MSLKKILATVSDAETRAHIAAKYSRARCRCFAHERQRGKPRSIGLGKIPRRYIQRQLCLSQSRAA